MNRIKRRHSDKDRVVCVSIPSKQWFYYQPARGNHRVYLFETEFSGSVFAYFRDRGRNLADRGFSLTIQELYEHHCRRNPKIDFLLRRLPGAIDRALREGRSDLSVHSLKDVPMDLPVDLPLIGYSRREDPRDVLVLPEGAAEIDFSKPIGTSSLRRSLQLQELFPQARFESIRGNLQTRLRKLDAGGFGAIVLAAAGVKRMGLAHRISRYFSVEEILPAAGQGILAVQGRAGEDYGFLAGYDDGEARVAATAERAFVRTLNGGCSSPVAAHAQVRGDELCLTGLYYNEQSGKWKKAAIQGGIGEAEALGIRLAGQLKEEVDRL